MLSNLHDQFTTQVRNNEEGDLVLDFPEELLETVGWREGDTVLIETVASRIVFRKCDPEEGTSKIG
jgi:bifunctional DNA-binding transcriptional regulator/antitoxin component of YhaV-PrlF toxin-antitoxin module